MSNKQKWPIENGKGQSGSGTTRGYSVEARFAHREPRAVGGELFDNRWKRVHWIENSHGIGNPRPYFRENVLDELGLMGLNEAEALRWNFLCLADASGPAGSLCFETRLVKHEVKYSRSETPVEYLRPQDGRGDIPEDMREEPQE
jgi:hypothetical protein